MLSIKERGTDMAELYLPLSPLRAEIPAEWTMLDYSALMPHNTDLWWKKRGNQDVAYILVDTSFMHWRHTRLSFRPNNSRDGVNIVLFDTLLLPGGKMKGIQIPILNAILNTSYYKLLVELWN